MSSELKNPELEQKLLARFRSLEFTAEDVDTMVTTLPDRLPAVLRPRAFACEAARRDSSLRAAFFAGRWPQPAAILNVLRPPALASYNALSASASNSAGSVRPSAW